MSSTDQYYETSTCRQHLEDFLACTFPIISTISCIRCHNIKTYYNTTLIVYLVSVWSQYKSVLRTKILFILNCHSCELISLFHSCSLLYDISIAKHYSESYIAKSPLHLLHFQALVRSTSLNFSYPIKSEHNFPEQNRVLVENSVMPINHMFHINYYSSILAESDVNVLILPLYLDLYFNNKKFSKYPCKLPFGLLTNLYQHKVLTTLTAYHHLYETNHSSVQPIMGRLGRSNFSVLFSSFIVGCLEDSVPSSDVRFTADCVILPDRVVAEFGHQAAVFSSRMIMRHMRNSAINKTQAEMESLDREEESLRVMRAHLLQMPHANPGYLMNFP